MPHKKFKKTIEEDIKFILRDYPFKEIFKGDLTIIKNLVKCKIACFSHKKKQTIKGLSMYSHFQRKDMRESLFGYVDEFLDKYLTKKGIKKVDYGYGKIKRRVIGE
jgi:hypothetical protein